MVGCTVLFSGDFRQILPVIASGTWSDEVNASPKRLYPWPDIIKCELKTNIRILSSIDRQFSDDLLQMGNGEFKAGNVKISLNKLYVFGAKYGGIDRKDISRPLKHYTGFKEGLYYHLQMSKLIK